MAAVGLAENQDFATPGEFDRITRDLAPEDLMDKLRISSDLGRHVEWIRGDAELGFDEVYLHHVGPAPESFLRAFAREVLPAFA